MSSKALSYLLRQNPKHARQSRLFKQNHIKVVKTKILKRNIWKFQNHFDELKIIEMLSDASFSKLHIWFRYYWPIKQFLQLLNFTTTSTYYRGWFKEFFQIQAMLLINFDEAEHHNSISSPCSIMIDQPFLNVITINSINKTKHANIS